MVDMQTHVFSYRHDGRHWQVTLKATDADDARARIGKLAYATYDGIQVARVPVALAPFGLLALWARNAAIRFISRFRPPIA
jgi:hypothetical protein